MIDQNRLHSVKIAAVGFTAAAIALFVLWLAGWLPLNGPDLSARLLFLAPDEQGVVQIFAADPLQGRGIDAAQTGTLLTSGNRSVLDFAVAPSGEWIVFTAAAADGSHDLFLYNVGQRSTTLLLECEAVSCTQPVWFPDETQLVYERRALATTQEPPGLARLFWVDLDGQTTSVFEEGTRFGLGAAFSPDGRWLAMVVPEKEEIFVINLSTGRSITTSSSSGERPVWGGPEGLYFSELDFQGERLAVHLFFLDVSTAEIVDLSGDQAVVNDGSPNWFAPENQLAFARKAARTASGRQVWIMEGDGSNQQPLTDAFEFNNGRPVWSPDGRFIAVQRFALEESFAEPSIWVIDVATNDTWQLSKPGTLPGWLP